MTTIVYAVVPPLVSTLLAIGGSRLGRALSGRAAAITLTAAALVTALGTGLVLCAIAYLAVAQWTPIARLGHWSAAAVAARDPVPLGLAVPCGVLAVGLLTASLVRAASGARRLALSIGYCRQLGGTPGDLVIVDDPVPDAYALAGLPGRAVVTRSMLRGLNAGERSALLAHEAAHVHHRHFLYVQLTSLAVAANPLLFSLLHPVQLAVERWADDDAAQSVGDRRLVATTLARATLARAGRASARPAHALGVAASDTRIRVTSLIDAPVTAARGRTVLALVVALTIAVAVSTALFAVHSHGVIEWAESRH